MPLKGRIIPPGGSRLFISLNTSDRFQLVGLKPIIIYKGFH